MFGPRASRFARLAMAALLALPLAVWFAPDAAGILLLAHGAHTPADHDHHSSASVWNANVEELVRRLDGRRPTEVAFGMADPESIQAAVDRLERRGVREMAVIPLFVSSHSPIIGNFRYILGLQGSLAKTTRVRHLDRISTKARLSFAGGMDAHPLVSEILLERARTLADDPATTGVVVIAHGPNDHEENRLWLRDMEAHARFLRDKGGFRSVAVLTHRNDASAPVKAEARRAFREKVAEAALGGTAVVVPLLLSAGGIEAQVEADLDGLAYRFAKPLLPHPNIERWVVEKADELLRQEHPPDRRGEAGLHNP